MARLEARVNAALPPIKAQIDERPIMKFARCLAFAFLVAAVLPARMISQQISASQPTAVPHLVNFSARATDERQQPIAGVAGITFSIYKDQYAGAALWIETQSVATDKAGNFTAQLGATKAGGMPLDLFTSGEARWLGVRVNGGQEQSRILLLSVPYALKAADAETVGGLPASAFVLASPERTQPSVAETVSTPDSIPPPASTVTTSGGTANALPLWTTATNVQSSAISQTGSGATAKIGINTTAPTTALDVHGGSAIRGTLVLPATGAATSSAGKVSQPEDFVASSFSSATSTPVNQTFQWQATPTNNNTSNPGATLNLLFGLGATSPAQTGLRIGPKGIIGFAPGQTFPGTGRGTITGVTAGADLTGGGTAGAVTLSLDTTKVPQLATANTFTANQTINGNLTTNSATINGLVTIPVAASTAIDASSSSASATTIVGVASSTTGDAWGVEGYTGSDASNAYGVIGVARSATSNGVGTYGVAFSPTGVGVFGQNGTQSTTGVGLQTSFVNGVGVWGDGGLINRGFGVAGTVDTGTAGIFQNNAAGYTTVTIFNNAVGPSFSSGSPGGSCDIDQGGNLNCTGTKNAVVPLDGGKRIVAMSAIEAPQNWFEDAGSAHLVSGAAVVSLDSDYLQTVNTEREYQVFLTPYGDCKGLYVANRTANSFEVHELGGGTASLSFGYRIMALRKKYEEVRFADHTNDPDPRKMKERTNSRAPQAVSLSKKLISMAPAAKK
jgi:trimeric autotransporter adhesin